MNNAAGLAIGMGLAAMESASKDKLLQDAKKMYKALEEIASQDTSGSCECGLSKDYGFRIAQEALESLSTDYDNLSTTIL